MPFRGPGCDRTDEKQPRFHGATADATCPGISSDGPDANAPHANANFYTANADAQQFDVSFARANADTQQFNASFSGTTVDAAHLDNEFYNELHLRNTPFQRRRLRSG